MKNKIFLAYHLDTVMPTDDLFVPLNGSMNELETLQKLDNFNLNIIDKNGLYSELTMLYHLLWNVDNVDFIGTGHYRRVLLPDGLDKFRQKFPNEELVLEYGKESRPMVQHSKEVYDYIFNKERSANAFKYLEDKTFDIIVGEPFTKTNKFSLFSFANIGWIPLRTITEFYNFIETFLPENESQIITDITVNHRSHYCNNMFMSSKDIYNAYCHWMFSILFKFEEHLKTLQHKTGKSYIVPRMFGYFSEYLLKPFTVINDLNVGFSDMIAIENLKTDDRI